MQNKLVKVCCITSLKEAELALELGADYLGFVSEMPSGPGVISLDNIAKIVSSLPEKTKTITLTSKVDSKAVFQQYKVTKTWGLQLVDKLPEGELLELKRMLPGVHLTQVVHVQNRYSIEEALAYVNLVDMLILDSGNPKAKLKTLGGTGTTHDWDISKEICAQSSTPVLLAGGLNPDNIQSAFSRVLPSGVDVCSGVRKTGLLDRKLLEDFMLQLDRKPIE
mgnify:CR=1 FL=1